MSFYDVNYFTRVKFCFKVGFQVALPVDTGVLQLSVSFGGRTDFTNERAGKHQN